MASTPSPSFVTWLQNALTGWKLRYNEAAFCYIFSAYNMSLVNKIGVYTSLKKSFRNTIKVSNSLDPEQARRA